MRCRPYSLPFAQGGRTTSLTRTSSLLIPRLRPYYNNNNKYNNKTIYYIPKDLTRSHQEVDKTLV